MERLGSVVSLETLLYSDDGSLNRQFLNLEPRLSLNIST